MALLEITDLTTHFHTYKGVVQALDQVTLTIEHGETFGLVGESGCGKSVTVQSIMGLVRPPGKVVGGSIRFRPDRKHPDQCEELLFQTETRLQTIRGNQIAMIFQEPNAALDAVMTIGKQVAEVFLFHCLGRLCADVRDELAVDPFKHGLLPRLLQPMYDLVARDQNTFRQKLTDRLPVLKRWRKPLWIEAQKRAATIIGQLGIAQPQEILSQYPHHLSGGMKQRMVIAMALAADPVLLIADEATSNLDVTIQAQILDLMLKLKETIVSALLFITHDLGVVAEICDRVGVMYAGTLCEVATVETLFNQPVHPYTRALLNSVPKLTNQGELTTIFGSVPNLLTPPSGCRFHPRCRIAGHICKNQKPRLVYISDTHQVACHHWEKSK